MNAGFANQDERSVGTGVQPPNPAPSLDAWDKCSDLVHWENLEGMGGEGGGRGDWDGEHM